MSRSMMWHCDVALYDVANYDVALYNVANYDVALYDAANYDVAHAITVKRNLTLSMYT